MVNQNNLWYHMVNIYGYFLFIIIIIFNLLILLIALISSGDLLKYLMHA